MKKMNLYLWLTALAGLFVSCSQDETDGLQTDKEGNRVSLTASLPDDFAQPGTRALPSATGHQLRCILEVWTQDRNPALKQRMEKAGLSGNNVTFDFTIEEGTYQCLFWADFIATDATENENAQICGVTCTHYADKYYKTDDATNGLQAVSLIEETYAGAFNTDARDAFFGRYILRKMTTAVENPPIPALTRPFAKLTVKEKNATNYGYCSGLTAAYKVPNTFNVLDGRVGSTTLSVTCSSKSSEPQTLFSDYIFTDATSTLGSVELTFTGTDKELLPITIPAGIPLKRNYKTNASGNLITEKLQPTDNVKLTVEMTADWESPDEEYNANSVWDGKYPTSKEEARAWMGTESAGADDTDGRNHVFTITAARQLAALHYLMITEFSSMNGTTEYHGYEHATYKLETDIDLNEKDWTPIGGAKNIRDFMGIFDGQGHTIRGMKITGDYSASGFFYRVSGSRAIIKHLNVKGQVAQQGSTNWADILSGGITGMLYNSACIAFCSFEGMISTTHPQGGKIFAGGIAGQVGGGSSAGQIISCYSVVTEMNLGGTATQGGIAGNIYDGTTIKGCYWKELSGIGHDNPYGAVKSGPITVENNGHFADAPGLNAVVGTMNTYKGDCNYEWQAGTGNGYPVLVKME